jgi:hypothetical protein
VLLCASESRNERETADKSSNADIRYYLRPRTPRFHHALPPRSSSLRLSSRQALPAGILAVDTPSISSELERNRTLLGKLDFGILGHEGRIAHAANSVLQIGASRSETGNALVSYQKTLSYHRWF